MGAKISVRLVAARSRWSAGELSALSAGETLELEGLRRVRGALEGGVDLSLGGADGPRFSATLTPRGARVDAPATPHGATVMTASSLPDPPSAGLERAVLDAIPVEVVVEIARATATVGEVASWRVGAVIEFASAIGETAVLRAGGRAIAHGELVELEGRVGVRVTEVL